LLPAQAASAAQTAPEAPSASVPPAPLEVGPRPLAQARRQHAVTHRRPDWRPAFLRVIAETNNVKVAARAAGVDRATPYVRAARDPKFASAWARAREIAVDLLEGEAFRRAFGGSDALLMYMLRSWRPERYGSKLDVRFDLRREAELVAAKTGRTVDEVLDAADRRARELGA
jgi:hypothetical protein